MKTIKDMITHAKELYPESRTMQRQWVRKTAMLINQGKHVLYGGKANWGVPANTGKFNRYGGQ